jgi:prepilin-type N-terminal cleavage/methylation domain-containing protein
MTAKSSGFTMTELITVIIMLGILSAIAVPRFIDLTNSRPEVVRQEFCARKIS